MNSGKTEFILFRSRSKLTKYTTRVADVNGKEVPRSGYICYLGVWFDQYMTLKSHITKKCTTAMLSFQKIKLIRRYLTKGAATTLVVGQIISHFDYCNSILYGLPDCNINKFQRIQNKEYKISVEMW